MASASYDMASSCYLKRRTKRTGTNRKSVPHPFPAPPSYKEISKHVYTYKKGLMGAKAKKKWCIWREQERDAFGKKGVKKKSKEEEGVKWSCEGGHRLRRRWLPCRELLLRLGLLLYLSLASGALCPNQGRVNDKQRGRTLLLPEQKEINSAGSQPETRHYIIVQNVLPKPQRCLHLVVLLDVGCFKFLLHLTVKLWQ